MKCQKLLVRSISRKYNEPSEGDLRMYLGLKRQKYSMGYHRSMDYVINISMVESSVMYPL
jgi:hypothetical protein